MSDSSGSDDNDDDDAGTSAEGNTCYDNGDGRGYSNTGSGGSSAEWMRFLSPSALSEMVGAMAKAKASSSKKSRKNPKLGKSKNIIARKGKAEKKIIKNSSKTEGRKSGV